MLMLMLTFKFILLETVEGEGFEVVLGGIVLDDGELSVDEGEEEDVAEGAGQLHSFHRNNVAEEGKGGGALQLPLPFAMLLLMPRRKGRRKGAEDVWLNHVLLSFFFHPPPTP